MFKWEKWTCFSVWPRAFQYRGQDCKADRSPLVTVTAFACPQPRVFSSGASTSWYTKEMREVSREKAEPLDGSVWDIKHCARLQMVILMSAMWFWYLAKWYLSFCKYKLQNPWVRQLIKEEENAVMQQNWRHLVNDANQHIEVSQENRQDFSFCIIG